MLPDNIIELLVIIEVEALVVVLVAKVVLTPWLVVDELDEAADFDVLAKVAEVDESEACKH